MTPLGALSHRFNFSNIDTMANQWVGTRKFSYTIKTWSRSSAANLSAETEKQGKFIYEILKFQWGWKH